MIDYQSLKREREDNKNKIRSGRETKMLQKNVVINGRVPETISGSKSTENEVVNNSTRVRTLLYV